MQNKVTIRFGLRLWSETKLAADTEVKTNVETVIQSKTKLNLSSPVFQWSIAMHSDMQYSLISRAETLV